ncbi:integrase-like protein [Vibrio ponticus]|nr:integrase-like protein [Vibrio ponticus]
MLVYKWRASLKKNVPSITDSDRVRHFTKLLATSIDKDAIDELTSGVYSKSSLLALSKDWNLFLEFCQTKGVSPIPASTTAVRLYIEKVSAEKKYATVKRYVVTISLVHKVLGYADPTKNGRVQSSLSAIRIDKKGDHQSTLAFKREHLEQLQSRLERSESVKDWRDLAIYHVMYECLLKRFELRELTLEDVYIHNDEISVFVADSEIRLSKPASLSLLKWLNVRGS